MAIVTANIVSGAFDGSTSLLIAAGVNNGVVIVVYRGDWVLGSGVAESGMVTVPVTRLATGDVIQASVTERGNQAGIPVTVQPSSVEATGWLTPLTVRVTGPDGEVTEYSAADYLATFGEKAGDFYDPLQSGLSVLPADYDRQPITELGFDVEQVQQPGTTTLRVLPRTAGGLLVGWNGATPTTPAPFTVTASGTVNVRVLRDDAVGELTRTVSVNVLPGSAATPSAGDITSAAWRLFGSSEILVFINSSKPCEVLIAGYSSDFVPATFYGFKYQDINFAPVPGGTYTCRVRVIGETNPANYFNFIIAF